MKDGKGLNFGEADDNYAIRMASENGHTEVVKLLLAAGVDAKADGNYAIRMASDNGHVEVVSCWCIS